MNGRQYETTFYLEWSNGVEWSRQAGVLAGISGSASLGEQNLDQRRCLGSDFRAVCLLLQWNCRSAG